MCVCVCACVCIRPGVSNAAEIKQRAVGEAPAYAVVSAQLLLHQLQVWMGGWVW